MVWYNIAKDRGDHVRNTRILVLLAFMLIILNACNSATIKNGVEWPIEDFNYTDQDNKPFGLAELKGKVWVANFIFTNCETVCPPITANMARIQKMIEEEDLDQVELVSFSVDPEVDQPEVLKAFAENFTEDLHNWHFLTGYVQKHIEQFAKKNFKTQVYKPEDSDQVIHGTDLFLVNQKGIIVKYYSALDVPYEELLSDIQILLKQSD